MFTVLGRRFARLHKLSICIFLLALLAACTQQQPPTPTLAATPLPAIEIRPTGGVVKAAGKVVPVDIVNLSVPASGSIVSLTIQVGDGVQAGDLLLMLDSRPAEAGVAQAEAAVAQAKANLALLQAVPHAAELAAAQANIDAAQARVAQLKEGAQPEAVTAAQAELAAAQAARKQLDAGTSEQVRINARLTLSNTEVALQQAQTAYEQVVWRQDSATLPEAIQFQLAKNNYEAAHALYVALENPPTPDQIAAADARIEQAQSVLTQLQMPPSANQIAEAEAMVKSAQAALDLLNAGAKDESIVAATAALSQTQATLQLAQSVLDSRQLYTPMDGTVTAINGNLGENVLPGQTVVTIADLTQLQIETTDLSERDVARVAVGQSVTIFIEASGEEITGKVQRIAPQATTIGGDVVFAVTIVLDEQSSDLRWGMSVQVEIEN